MRPRRRLAGTGGIQWPLGREAWLVPDGVPIDVATRLLGHDRLSTTLDRYTHDARGYADLRVRQVSSALPADVPPTPGRRNEGARQLVRD